MKFLITAIAMVLAVAIAPSASQAVTVAACGSAQVVTVGTTYVGETGAQPAGGAGSCYVDFNAAIGPVNGEALATIGPGVASQYAGLLMQWISNFDNSILASTAITPTLTTLATLFSSPNNLSQRLILSWTNSDVGATGFDFEVSISQVPIPAALPLLFTALAALGWLGRRRAVA